MYSYSLTAPAKINLHLEIIGDRPDAYHQLVMIMQSINLADKIEIWANGTDKIRIHCQNPQVPLDKTNLAYRAALLMQQQFPQQTANYGGMDITIEKNIPIAAGLAGGSSNAAAVLVGINLMWELGLTQPELQELGAMIGSDVPFCISGGTAIATGRGEKIEPLPDLDNLWVVLAKYSNISVSTAWAYHTYRQKFGELYVSDSQGFKMRTEQIHSGSLVKAIMDKDSQIIGQLLYNDLEKVVLPEFPLVADLIATMKALGGLGTIMSGSGPTVFCLCETKIQAQQISQQLKSSIADPNLDLWIAKMCSHGIINN
jgi:4-diphosphocytidyl-2-C-methyl-D-erythritol kinase